MTSQHVGATVADATTQVLAGTRVEIRFTNIGLQEGTVIDQWQMLIARSTYKIYHKVLYDDGHQPWEDFSKHPARILRLPASPASLASQTRSRSGVGSAASAAPATASPAADAAYPNLRNKGRPKVARPIKVHARKQTRVRLTEYPG